MKSIVLVLSLAWFSAAFASGHTCVSALDERFEIPPGYGMTAEDLAEVAAIFPTFEDTLIEYAKLARFLEGDSDEFFDLLGSYHQLGYARGTWERLVPGSGRDFEALGGAFHRRTQLDDLILVFRHRGLMPTNLGPAAIDVLQLALGPLEYSDPVVMNLELQERLTGVQGIKAFVERNPLKIRDLMDSSTVVMAGMLSLFVDTESPNVVSPAEAMAAWRARREGRESPDLDPRLKSLLDDVGAYLAHRKMPPGYETPNLSWLGRSASRKVTKAYDVMQSGLGVTALFKMALNEWTERPLDSAYARDPWYYMFAFDLLLERDAVIDRGLAPTLRRAFAEIVLGKTALTGPAAKKRVGEALKHRLGLVKKLWRPIKSERDRAIAERDRALRLDRARAEGLRNVAEAGPDREQRLREHRDALAKAIVLPEVKAPKTIVARPFVAATPVTEDDEVVALWKDLLDENRSERDARLNFELKIQPETVYRLPIERTGFFYRVEFSPQLIEQMISPQAGEPGDVREWLKALTLGPAGARNQRGWRKDPVAVDGRSFWKIKLLGSPYRMMGTRLPSKVWRFERIGEFH